MRWRLIGSTLLAVATLAAFLALAALLAWLAPETTGTLGPLR